MTVEFLHLQVARFGHSRGMPPLTFHAKYRNRIGEYPLSRRVGERSWLRCYAGRIQSEAAKVDQSLTISPHFSAETFVTAAKGGVMLLRGCGAGIGRGCAQRFGTMGAGVGW